MGVAGVLSRAQDSRTHMDATVSSALRDLTGLMDNAREMVGIAERRRAATDGARGSGAAEDAAELEAWMLELGITTPVTKQSAGAVYHQQLARQARGPQASRVPGCEL